MEHSEESRDPQSPDAAPDAAPDAEPPVDRHDPSKDPDQWVTGDEPMTGPQESYLGTLSREAGDEVDPNLTKAEASKRIDELRERTGRAD